MPGVFISYRREDCPGHAGRLFDRLRTRFGGDSVFIDVAGIEAGVDFVEVLENAVGSCDVLLAVIGREWVTSSDKNGRRRLDDPRDFIRLEISTALARNVRVIPVLVEGAPVPTADVLPDDLKPLMRRQAVELRDTRWDADVDDLIELLAKILRAASPAAARRAPDDQPNTLYISPREPRKVADRAPRPVVTAPSLSTASRKIQWPGAAILLLVAGVMAAVVAPWYLPEWLGLGARRNSEQSAPTRRPERPPDMVVEPAVGPRADVDDPPAATPEQAIVPDVVGQPLSRATAALRSAGLAADSSPRTAGGVAPFQVLSQTPRAGARMASGSRVDLEYAKPMRTLPNVTGDALDDAVAILKASGFEPRPVARSTNDAAPMQVLSQTPPGGTDLEPGAVVELFYAVAAKIKVPNVVGLDLTIAQKTLRSAGLMVGTRTETQADAPPAQVVRQEPPAGSEVDRNSRVALVYASAPAAPPVLR
jgi:hypothetical protein